MKDETTARDALLRERIQHFDITRIDTREVVDAMKHMSFTARDLGRAAEIFDMMLRDPNASIVLSLAGSTGAGGCLKLYADLVKYNMIDAIVATGASIVDMDFLEALGFHHYRGRVDVDDNKLRDKGFHTSVGARAGAEVQFGFIGIPELSLQGYIGLYRQFNVGSTVTVTDGDRVRVSDRTVTLSTGTGPDPWDLFAGSIAALYYF